MIHHFYKRRDFLKTVGVGVITLALDGCQSNDNANVTTLNSLKKARKLVAHKKRRIIMNNDGNDFAPPWPDNPEQTDFFLNRRTIPLLGSQVNSIFYCTGVFNQYTHLSTETEPCRAWQGVDPLEIKTTFCHKHELEIFWSMRMNDTHDSGSKRTLCKWKQNHPECLVGKRGDNFPYGCNRWSSLNYGMSDVREKIYSILEDVCTRYNVDGIEMDFFRHPVLFKPQMTGEPVTQEHCDQMTELVQKVRMMTEYVGKHRSRPMLIAIRIPDSVGYCKALGIDLIRWLEDDLIDIVVVGGYFKLEPWENLVALGKKYDVPVYACLVKRRIQEAGEPEGATALKIWRGEALNAWKAGVDGIYTFNRVDPYDQIFREIGDPELLKTLDRIDQTVYVNEKSWSRPERWLKDGRQFIQLNRKNKA